MTTEEFYADALLAAFSAIVGKYADNLIPEYADEWASKMTDVFEKNRAKYQGGSNVPH
jgi:hypothetical protein